MSSSDLWTWCLEAWGREEIVSPEIVSPRSPQANSNCHIGLIEASSLPFCHLPNPLAHLTEEADVEAESSGIPGTSIHKVADKQGNLQEVREALTLPQLLACGSHGNNLWLDVLHLLIEH